MAIPHELADLLATERRNVFSVALDVDPTKPEHQTPNPAYRIWLRNALRQALAGIPERGRDEAQETAHRILAAVDRRPVRGRGLVIFAGPDVWDVRVLPVPVPHYLRYGLLDPTPLLWALREYTPYAVVAVYRDHAWIAVAHLGRAAVVEEDTLALDTRDWRFKAGRSDPSARRAGVGVGRGRQGDTFEARVDEHLRRFWRDVARAATRALVERRIDRAILAGPEEAVVAVRAMLPDATRTRVIGTVAIPAYASPEEILGRTLPVALADRHRQEAALVTELMERAVADGSAVLGLAATLEALAQGKLSTVVVARDFDAAVWECERCRYVTAAPVEACPVCGGAVGRTTVRQALPLAAVQHGALLEVVGPAAGPALADGIGGLLRYRPRGAARAPQAR